MVDTAYLQPGDIMLFRPSSVFGSVIAIKTWHNISHVEIYVGNGQSVASRDGIGVGQYPVRTDHVAYVLRPRTGLVNVSKGQQYFDTMKGTPYGWWDLLNFVDLPVNARGIVCSPFATGWLRASGWDVFPTDPISKVAPFQFVDLIGDDCRVFWSDGK